MHDVVRLSGFGAYKHNGSQGSVSLFSVVQRVFLRAQRRLAVGMSVILSGMSSQRHPVGFNSVLLGLIKIQWLMFIEKKLDKNAIYIIYVLTYRVYKQQGKSI